MCDTEHLNRLRKGHQEWNSWRSMTPDAHPNLSGADLSGADLRSCDLSEADLTGADFTRANLSGTTFAGANVQFAKFRSIDGIIPTKALLKAANVPLAHYDDSLFGHFDFAHKGGSTNGSHTACIERRNLSGYVMQSWNFSGAQLDGWNLSDAHLQDCIFTGANLRGAILSGCDLTGASLRQADLEKSLLIKAVLYFGVLRGARLRGTDLTGADLRLADLLDCDLRDANCRDAKYAWLGEFNEFRKAKHFVLAYYSSEHANELGLPAGDHNERLKNKQLAKYPLNGANLEGMDLQGGDLSGADCRDVVLTGAKLNRAQLVGTDLRKAHLQGADLRQANLSDADLREAKLQYSDLSNACLKGAKVGNADLSTAKLCDADLRNADLTFAVFQNVNVMNSNMQAARLSGVWDVRSGAPGRGLSLHALKTTRNYLLAYYDEPSLLVLGLDKKSLEKLGIEEAGRDHCENVGANKYLRYDFDNSNLCDADLDNADLSAATFRNTQLCNASLEMAEAAQCDFRYANLFNAKLQNAQLTDARFRNADLTAANLCDVRGLVPEQLAATDLTGAKLPGDIAAFNSLANIREVSASARTVFFAMLLLCVYAWVQLLATKDSDLLSRGGVVSVPILQIQISVATFYLGLPLLLVALFFWCHFYLQHLWEELAQLPAKLPDGRPLYRRVYPWLLNSMVSIHFPILAKDRPFLTHLQVFSCVLLAWWIVPMTIVAIWWRYLRSHDLLVSTEHAIMACLALAGGATLQQLAGATLGGQPRVSFDFRTALRDVRCRSMIGKAVVGLLAIALVTYGLIVGPQPSDSVAQPESLWAEIASRFAARLEGAEVSVRRPHWRGETGAERDQVQGAVLAGRDMTRANARRAFLAAADIRGTDLRGAIFQDSNLRWADLQNARLDFTTLIDADLRDADFRGAQVFRTNFAGAKLDGADLRGVDLRNALGLNSEQIGKAKRDALTRLPIY